MNLAELIESYHPDNVVGSSIKNSKRNDLSIDNFRKRDMYTKKYSWAIPTLEAIEAIANFTDRIHEVGAGSGLWAKLLTAAGISRVVATDAYEIGHVHKHGRFHPVQRMNHRRALRTFRNGYTLMLCWPPYDEPMSHEALKRFNGDKLVYIGEGHYGCTGTDTFHRMLNEEWNREQEVYLPNWSGIHDYLTLYTKKGD